MKEGIELQASSKNIENIFQKNQFVIPEYQRPYSWKEEHCEKLWNDLIGFYREKYEEDFKKNQKQKIVKKIYFLGTVVFCQEDKSSEEVLHIIDGQQRITTLMLLLKAIYRKIHEITYLDKEKKGDIRSLFRRIGEYIWNFDTNSGDIFFDEPRIKHLRYKSKSEDNKPLKKVLSNKDLSSNKNSEEYSDISKDDEDQYSKNYLFFIDKLDKILETDWRNREDCLYDFSNFLEDKCYLLPIICKDEDMGLNIFETINDRGLQLSHVNIFKYKLYKSHKKIKKVKEFDKKWKKIHDICGADPQSYSDQKKIENIFTYTMHVIRAIEAVKRVKSKKPGAGKAGKAVLRLFYAEEHREYLEDPNQNLMEMIEDQANLWSEIHKDFSKSLAQNHYPNIVPEGDGDSKKYIQLLNSYIDDKWKWVVSALWHHQKSNGSGIQKLKTSDLRKLVAFFYFAYLKSPKKAPEIRQNLFDMNQNIISGKTLFEGDALKFDKKTTITKEEIKQGVEEGFNFFNNLKFKSITPTNAYKIKILVFLHTYLNPDQAYIPEIGNMNWKVDDKDSDKNEYEFKFEYQIEHILPKKWKNANYAGWTEEDAEKYIERIGNKALIEETLNIQAGAGYFNQKKKEYEKSKIADLKKLSQKKQKDWLPKDIEEREKEMIQQFTDFFWAELNQLNE